MPAAWGDAYRADVCSDCLQMWANGWDEREPVPVPVPLNRLPYGGLLMWKSDEPHFSVRPCDTCGQWLAGDRFDVEIVEPA
jgi:hypothetical protein